MPLPKNPPLNLLASQKNARAAGIPSSGSKPNPMAASLGGRFAAMENALLRTKKPDPKKLAKGGGQQFKKQASGA